MTHLPPLPVKIICVPVAVENSCDHACGSILVAISGQKHSECSCPKTRPDIGLCEELLIKRLFWSPVLEPVWNSVLGLLASVGSGAPDRP